MQQIQVIPILSPADYQTGSQDTDSIDTTGLHRLDFVINFGAITGNDATFKLYSGATNASKDTELPFKYRLSAADHQATLADTYGAYTSVAIGSNGLILTDASGYNNRTVVIEFMCDQMTDGEEFITMSTDDGSASVLFFDVIAIGYPRHSYAVGQTHL